VEAVLLWSRFIRGLTTRSRADAPKSGAPLNANVEAVEKVPWMLNVPLIEQ
jgi:hypothetical protein